MALSINTSGTYKVTRASNADSLTGWSAIKLEGSGGSPSAFLSVGTIDSVAEGSDAVATRTNKQRVELRYTLPSSYDFTSGSTGSGTVKIPSGIIFIWALFLAAGALFTKANGGMQIALSDGTNISYWNVAGNDTYSGGFQKWATYTGSTPSETNGTAANLGAITSVSFITDVGTNVTRFDNFVVDAIDIGLGLTIQGTTTTNSLFSESYDQDALTAIGVFSKKEGIIFSQGSIEFSGTQTSDSETMVFSDTLGGAYTYKCDITGTVTFTNSSISAAGVVDYDFDSSTATAFTMNGGALSNYKTLTTASGQTISGAVFQAGGTATIANTISNSTFNGDGKITVTGSLSNCTINKSTATEAVSVANTNLLPNLTVYKDTGTSHAVELTGAAGTYTWNVKDPNATYTAGTAGTNVETEVGVDATGNEHLLITALSGAFTISIADGATTPSVAKVNGSTATVEVVAGQKDFKFTLNPSITGYEWRAFTLSIAGNFESTKVVLGGEEVASVDNHTITHSFTNQPIAIQILPMGQGYVEKIEYYTLTAVDSLNNTINLTKDVNA